MILGWTSKRSAGFPLMILCVGMVLCMQSRAEGEKPLTLTIQDAVRMALESNLDIAIQRIQPEIARNNTQVARGGLDPKTTLGVNYGESQNPRTAEQIAADGRSTADYRNMQSSASVSGKSGIGTTLTASTSLNNSQNTYNNFNDQVSTQAGISLTQPLLRNFGETPNLGPIRIARRNEQVAMDQFYHQVEQVVHDVLAAYYEVVYAKSNLESRRQSLKLAQQLLSDNQAKLQIGVVSPLDVSQARSEAATRQGEVLTAEATLLQNANALKRLISSDLAKILEQDVLPVDPLVEPKGKPKRVQEIALGLQSRRDYLAKLKSAENDGLQVAINRNQMLPQLDLVTSYANSGLAPSHGRSVEDTINGKGDNWVVGFTFQIPWGYYAEKGNLANARAQQKQTLLQLKQLEQVIFAEVDNAYIQLWTSAEKVTTTKIARLFAEESLKAEQERLLAGASTTYTVLQLQRDLANARNLELRALADYNESEVELKRAQGILLTSNNIQVVEP